MLGGYGERNVATENTEDTETEEKEDLTEQMLGAAIEVHNIGCFRPVDGIDRISP